MRKTSRIFGCVVIFAGILLAAFPAPAQQAKASDTAPITTVVTVLGPKFTAPTAIGKEDVIVNEGQARKDVTGWTPAQGDKAALQLAILIDDSTRKDLGKQIDDIGKFIKSQPQSTSVGVYYASNGTIQVASQFSRDHEAVAKVVRMPLGNFGASSSIYLSLMAMIDGWPVTNARREILLIADGYDRLRQTRFSPDVQATIDKSQQAGIVIHSIYASAAGRFSSNRNIINIGQGNLNQITGGTGGQAFFQGNQTPMAFAPYLTEFDTVLKNQYFLTFSTSRSKKEKGEFRSIKVRTEQKNVEITAADKVFVPGP
jgi:hypothetical protein